MQVGSQFRIGALVVGALWVAALFAPYSTAPRYGAQADPSGMHGWFLAAWGWLGPMGLSIAWYANLSLIFCVVRMLAGKAPEKKPAVIGCAIACTALLPSCTWSFETGGCTPAVIWGLAVWLWLAAFAIVVAMSLWPPPHHAKAH